jgi:hypothetical protein
VSSLGNLLHKKRIIKREKQGDKKYKEKLDLTGRNCSLIKSLMASEND